MTPSVSARSTGARTSSSPSARSVRRLAAKSRRSTAACSTCSSTRRSSRTSASPTRRRARSANTAARSTTGCGRVTRAISRSAARTSTASRSNRSSSSPSQRKARSPATSSWSSATPVSPIAHSPHPKWRSGAICTSNAASTFTANGCASWTRRRKATRKARSPSRPIRNRSRIDSKTQKARSADSNAAAFSRRSRPRMRRCSRGRRNSRSIAARSRRIRDCAR